MHRALSSSIFRSLQLDLRFLLFLQAVHVVVTAARPVAASGILHYTRQLSPPNGGLSPGSVPPRDPQAAFSDGGGSGYNVPAVLWIGFAALVGLPLAAGGVRGWRITSGFGVGLVLSLLLWTMFVNTTAGGSLAANPTTSDLYLTLFIWGAFLLGVALGSLRVGIYAGVSMLGASAGIALGISVVLLKPGLLFPIYALNILPMGLFAAVGAGWPLWHQRLAVIVSSSTCGSFLTALAVDLVLNKQSGMSLGLRFLLDRNSIHRRETLQAGYKPPVSTLIIIGVGIGLIPVFSYFQHRIFKGPFNRSPESLEEYKRSLNGKPMLGPGDEGYTNEKEPVTNTTPQHVQLRFPSIVPSLPGNVDPQYAAQQQALRAQHGQYNVPSRAAPGPGVGRLPFMPYFGAAVNAAKRMSISATRQIGNTAKRMSMLGGFLNNGADRRASTFSTPSVYSVNPADRNGASSSRAFGNGNGYGQSQRRQQHLQQPIDIMRDSDAYSGVLSPTRPLNLPNRQATNLAARGAPGISYASPPMRGTPQQVSSPPAASLRTNRLQGREFGVGGQQQQQQQVTDINYNNKPRGTQQQLQGGNRLKSSQRYNGLL